MNQVTTEQAIATYKATVKNEPREYWANWILAIQNSLIAGEWIGGTMFPDYAKSAFETIKTELI